MTKKRGITFVIIILLITIPCTYFFIKQGLQQHSDFSMSGMAIGELTPNIELNLSIIIFAIQWIILGIIGIIIYIRFIKNKKQEQKKLNIPTEATQAKLYSQTDIDTLYKLLKEKNSLSTETIGKIFGIKKDKALEWAKILENHELVTIEYPAFSDPEIIINTNTTKNEKEEDFVAEFFSIKQEGEEKEEKQQQKKTIPTQKKTKLITQTPKKITKIIQKNKEIIKKS